MGGFCRIFQQAYNVLEFSAPQMGPDLQDMLDGRENWPVEYEKHGLKPHAAAQADWRWRRPSGISGWRPVTVIRMSYFRRIPVQGLRFGDGPERPAFVSDELHESTGDDREQRTK
jgi:hypothetical protein